MKRNSPIDRSKVLELTGNGMTPWQIVPSLNRTIRAVRHAQTSMGIGPRLKRGRPSKEMMNPVPSPRQAVEFTNPVSAISHHFGNRVTEVNGTFRLDGRPTSFFELMKRMNSERKSAGREQVGHGSLHV